MSDRQGMAWHYLVESSLQYYAAGRFCAMSRLTSAAPQLLHLAVELILKACLARDHSLDDLRKTYLHNIRRLWQDVTNANSALTTPGRDQAIHNLARFEALRYPDSLISQGASISFDFRTRTDSGPPQTGLSNGPSYEFNMEDIDELWKAIFVNSRANVVAFLQRLSQEARAAIDRDNLHPIG
jgi:hypothetical protein